MHGAIPGILEIQSGLPFPNGKERSRTHFPRSVQNYLSLRVELVYTTDGGLSSPSRALYVLASLYEFRIGEESHFVEREAQRYRLCCLNRERSVDSDEKGL